MDEIHERWDRRRNLWLVASVLWDCVLFVLLVRYAHPLFWLPLWWVWSRVWLELGRLVVDLDM